MKNIVSLTNTLVFTTSFLFFWNIFSAISEHRRYKAFTEQIVKQTEEGKPRFIVLNYNEKGRIIHDLLCDEVRKDKEHRQVVCHCVEDGETYIFSYPVMIKDVTYTADYIEYNRTLKK